MFKINNILYQPQRKKEPDIPYLGKYKKNLQFSKDKHLILCCFSNHKLSQNILFSNLLLAK